MCSDFLVADENALICMLKSSLFEEIEPAKKKGHTLMHGIKSSISAIAVHPNKTLLAIAGADGFILLWDYIKKGDPISNYENFNKDKDHKGSDFKYFTCIEFTPDGGEILVTQHNGDIKVMDSETVQFKKLNTPLKISERSTKYHAIQLIVSHDGKYFAVCDNNSSVSLFKKDHLNGDTTKPIDWFFTGKIKSHEIGVSSIAFGNGLDEQGVPMHRLFSIG
jgi:WD40 repeat protein